MHKQISSLQNPLIKKILLLQEKSKERKKTGLFVIEGRREIELAIKGGYELETLLFCSELILKEELTVFKLNDRTQNIEISSNIYKKIAYRSTTEGVLAIAKEKNHSLEKVNINSKTGLILVAEAPEKPGNIGALLRTADAAKLDAVIIANSKTDAYNPNIIRSSLGCLFTNTIAYGSTPEVISFLKAHNITIYCAALENAVDYHTCDFKKASAIVVGTESIGLSKEWLEKSDANILIPMQGEIDSLNVSVAAGILIFEAKRQRDFI